MNFIRCSFVFIFLALFSRFGSGQPNVAGQPLIVQRDRIALRPDLRATTTLRGHIPVWAAGGNDRGSVADDTPLRLTFVLSRSPELQASFEQLLADQQNPNSPSYHQWLTPQEVGERYGPTQHDVDALTNWFGLEGLAVIETAPSRVFVSIAAPAGVIARALGTGFHSFEVNGERRLSAIADPALPTALAAVVGSIAGLADLDLQPMHKGEAVAEAVLTQGTGVAPRYTTSTGTHYLAPSDFATIFDLKAAYSAGYTGAGQKVAIIGRSRVSATDITAFQSKTGNTTSVFNTVIPTTGVDPGVTGTGDQGEATLDVERVMGTAPGAQVDLVVSGSTGGFSGLYLAAQYEVQTLRDPVMNISFGSCEAFNGPSGVSLWDAMFSQAASEGISVFVSSADSGAATCSTQFGAPQAYQFRSINYICASSYATCVGGSELVDTANPAQYWSSSNGANLASALSYIPEGAWNEPNSIPPYIVAGGGGGASIYVPKPVWQTGTGVPADGARDVPDVSFPSARHDAYYGCYALGGGDCNNGFFEFFYGTSAAAPAMAGVAALLNQKMGGAQGNMNPLLYRLAASSPTAFHDATVASSGVGNCDVNVASLCNNTTPSLNSLSGGVAGYTLTAGYDQATGLGSLDVNNFLNAVTSTKGGLAATTLAVRANVTTITKGETAVLTATVSSQGTGAPGGTVQFYANTVALGAAVTVVGGQAVTVALPFTAAGSYYITANYSGDTANASSVASGISLTVTGLTATTRVTASSTAIPIYTNATFSATVSPASGSIAPTGRVRFSLPGSTADFYVAIAPLVNGVATTPTINLQRLGSYTLTAFYEGDEVYSPSSSAVAVSVSVQKVASVAQLASTPGSIGVGGSKGYIVSIRTSVSTLAPTPTGTIQLYANGFQTGSPVVVNDSVGIAQGSAVGLFATAGTYSITAVYSGDANWLPATTNVATLTVLSTPASYQLGAITPALTVNTGGSTSDTISVTGVLGFAGQVSVRCVITYNGTGAATAPPTCGDITSNPVTVNVDSAAANYSFSVSTTAARSVVGAGQANATRPKGGWGQQGGAALYACLLCLTAIRRRPWWMLVILVAITAFSGAIEGCSGGGSSGGSVPGTTAGSYTVTITPSTVSTVVATPAPVSIALTVR